MYTYDNNNNIETVTDPEKIVAYQYDGQNRLISEVYSNNTGTIKSVGCTYDTFGNRLAQSVTDTSNDTAETEYSYQGNRLTSGGENDFTYDKNGNLLSDGETTYVYNARNKLISSTDSNGITTEYAYNAEGLRISKGSTRYHLNEAGQVILETENGTPTARMIWVDKPLARKVDDAYYYYIYNAHNDVVAMTDESGNIVKTYEYSAFGTVENETGSLYNPVKYAGEYQDEETGLIYLRARYYDPGIGRFTQQDPARDGKNWYVYCNNNPVNYIDKTGLEAISLSIGGIFFAAVLIYSLIAEGVRLVLLNGIKYSLDDNSGMWIPSSGSGSSSSSSGNSKGTPPDLSPIAKITAAAEVIQKLINEYGIDEYQNMQKIVTKLNAEAGKRIYSAHHILPQRFAKLLGLDTKLMKSFIVTNANHINFTNAWREMFPYGQADPAKIDVYKFALGIYNEFPEVIKIIKSAMDYLGYKY